MERKNLSLDEFEIKFDEARKGFFSGYASKFNGVDSYGDTIVPGAYSKTVSERERPIAMRWNHTGPVIGKWLKAEEDEHGLYVEGELTPGHSVATDVYALMKHGAVTGLSIGYRIPTGGSEKKGDVRLLKQIELVEISVVEEPADFSARISNIKSLSADNLENAIVWLKRAIKLHVAHMDGSAPTSEESQMKMMRQMEKALSYLLEDEGEGNAESMGAMKMLGVAASLKEVERLLRDAAGFSRADATALVARIKSLSRGERDDETKASELFGALHALHTQITART